MNTIKILKYVWPFYNILYEKVMTIIFRKTSILDVWLGSKYAFGELCTGWSTKGTSHYSYWKVFNNNNLVKFKLAVSSSTDTLLENLIFIDVFETEDYEYAALQKKLLTAPFVECFKLTTFGGPYW